VPLYRYRTAALAGRWRATRAEAARDAITSKQADPAPDQPDGLEWRVPGEIEEKVEAHRH
jgi:hypothetical protein